MTKNIKRVGLLKDTQPKTKTATQTFRNPQLAPEAVEEHGSTPRTANQALTKAGLGILLLCFIALIFIPKPELLRYQKLNTVATSIYWPGLYGVGEGLWDSELAVYIDRPRQELHLCFQHEQNEQCARYTILEQGGMGAVLMHLLGF
mgnify:CR=1 FL=1